MMDRDNKRDNKNAGNISKLRRKELLEILLKQTELTEKYERSYRRSVIELKSVQSKNEALETENESLKQQLSDMKRKMNRMSEELEERRIFIEESGSIAEAAARINGLFEAAQKTVDDFINNACKQKEEELSCSTR